MGVLDEAIKHHLELKRRHGADPGEVAELEREALGDDLQAADTSASPAQHRPQEDGLDHLRAEFRSAPSQVDAPTHGIHEETMEIDVASLFHDSPQPQAVASRR